MMATTTRPIFPSNPPVIRSDRLLLRPIAAQDLDDFHVLRTQPEVMIFTTSGKIDVDPDATMKWMERFLKPNDTITFSFAIEELANPGRPIGSVGSHLADPPTLGYMFRKEFWGKGYASEALKAWLPVYWALARKDVELKDDMIESKFTREGGSTSEVLIAEIESEHLPSIKVAERNGFKPTGNYEDVEDWRGKARIVEYYLERPSSDS